MWQADVTVIPITSRTTFVIQAAATLCRHTDNSACSLKNMRQAVTDAQNKAQGASSDGLMY